MGSTAREPVPRVAFVLGKPPERSPVIPEVISQLEQLGAEVRWLAPRAGDTLPDDLDQADLVIQRGLSPALLAELIPYAGRCVNDPVATAAVHRRAELVQALSSAGVPVPASELVADYAAARARARTHLVKAIDARTGRGAGVLTGDDLPEEAPFEGPYLVQEMVGDWEAKLYVFGDQVRGLRRPRGQDRGGEPMDVPDHLVGMARQVASAVGLELLGVDLMVAGDGAAQAWVIDVNPFPSAARVPGAVDLVTAHLRSRLP